MRLAGDLPPPFPSSPLDACVEPETARVESKTTENPARELARDSVLS